MGTDSSSVSLLEDELSKLREQVAALKKELAAERKAHAESRASASELEDFYQHAPCGFHSLDERGVFVSVNDTELSWLGFTREELVGKVKFTDLCTAEGIALFRDAYPRFQRDGRVDGIEFQLIRKDGSIMETGLSSVAIRDAAGKYLRSRSILLDITEHKRAEQAHRRAELQEGLIRAQAQTLAELSCPLLTVAHGVLVMPLIATVDAQRAARIQESLLDGISATRARVAILDITGVTRVDELMARTLLSTARAARLLGAEVVLTGIRPDAARALVEIGASLDELITRGTLESGIAYAVSQHGSHRASQASDDP